MNLYITPDAQAKIHAVVSECDTEVNGIGRVRFESGNCIIDEVEVLKQTVTASSAEHDTDDLHDFLASREDFNQWRVQWHSHVNMGVFWSGTDESAIASLGETADWMISIVFNKSGLYKARIDCFNIQSSLPKELTGLFPEISKHLTKDDLTLTIYHPVQDYSEWAKAVIKEKVKKDRWSKTDVGYKYNRDVPSLKDEPYLRDDYDYGQVPSYQQLIAIIARVFEVPHKQAQKEYSKKDAEEWYLENKYTLGL